MKDRGNAAYEPHYIWVPKKGRLKIGILSPTRQAKKARGLSGRQEVKWRKAQRRSA